MLTVNSVTNASRFRTVQKSTAREIALFTLFKIVILAGVQGGNWFSWKFFLLSVNLDNHWCNSMCIVPKKIS